MSDQHVSAALPPGVDLERPNAARVYDYLLGGSCNFEIDRAFGKNVEDVFPAAKQAALINRAFLRRAVHFLAESGVRQFLDLGSGVPTVGHSHEIAQRVDPSSTVVYVDIEPVAVAHSELILQDNDRAAIVQADLRETDVVLGAPETVRMLDFREPIGLLMVSVLPFVLDEHDPAGIIGRYADALPPGSYLAVSHATLETPAPVDSIVEMYKNTSTPATLRSREHIDALLRGWELVEPGLVYAPQWRPDSPEDVGDAPEYSANFAAVGRKRP
ncbi:MAG: hypothetical protein GEU98_21440 [Pseudonocardiaceae bacterium]|nr:hypothetical protein [Pseudonocardiaceae bacterium]